MKSFLLYIFSIVFMSNLYGQSNDLASEFFRYIKESRSIEFGYTEQVVEYIDRNFISNGLDINVKDQNGNTAIHLAASTNNLNMFYVAIAFDPNPKITNYNNRTAREEADKYIREHKGTEDITNSIEISNYLENYEKAYQIKERIKILKEIDKLNSPSEKINILDKFVESISSTDEVVGVYMFYELYKKGLEDTGNKEEINNIDLKWKNRINRIIASGLLYYQIQIQKTYDIKKILQVDEILAEIHQNLFEQLYTNNVSTLEKMQSFCQIRFSELSSMTSKLQLEKDTKLLISSFDNNNSVTNDKLIDEAIAFILDKERPFDKKKNLVLLNIMSLISMENYKGIYKQDLFINILKELYTLSRSYYFAIDNTTKAENMNIMLDMLGRRCRLLKDMKIRAN